MKTKQEPTNWITEGEAANQMGYKPKTLRRYAQEGRLKIGFTRVNWKTFEYNPDDIVRHKIANSTTVQR